MQKTMRRQGETPSRRPEVRSQGGWTRHKSLEYVLPTARGSSHVLSSRGEIKLCLGHLTSKVGYLGTHPAPVCTDTRTVPRAQANGHSQKKRRICSSCGFVPHRARGFPEQGVGGMRGPPHSTFHRAAAAHTHAPALGQRDLRSKCPRRLGAVPRRESRT